MKNGAASLTALAAATPAAPAMRDGELSPEAIAREMVTILRGMAGNTAIRAAALSVIKGGFLELDLQLNMAEFQNKYLIACAGALWAGRLPSKANIHQVADYTTVESFDGFTVGLELFRDAGQGVMHYSMAAAFRPSGPAEIVPLPGLH